MMRMVAIVLFIGFWCEWWGWGGLIGAWVICYGLDTLVVTSLANIIDNDPD